MTLLGLTDGEAAGKQNNISYLHLAEFLLRHGATPSADLQELWRRIVFNICVSNSDDHLRNHGCMLTPKGWILSPAYDINPVAGSTGLHLNISETSNELDLDLAREVAESFAVDSVQAAAGIEKITEAVSHWHTHAKAFGIPRSEMERMERAFTVK